MQNFPVGSFKKTTVFDSVYIQCNIFFFGNISPRSKLQTYRGSYMSAHALLNLWNELRKRDKVRDLPSITSLVCNELNKFNNAKARMLDYIYNKTSNLFKITVLARKRWDCAIFFSTL